MSDYRTILYEITGRNDSVCRITMNRPEKYNAINKELALELVAAFRRVREEDTVGVVVFAGAGKAFCTGGDLADFPSMLSDHRSSMNWVAHNGLDVQNAITGCEKVVVGKIDGHCLAGGLELALCCDLLYARESVRIGTTEINMGILPGWGGTARMPRSLPLFRAREIIYSGRKDYSAREMYEMGLLTRVFTDEEFEERFEETIANLSSKNPNALRMAKEIMAKSAEGGSIDAALALERNGTQWLLNSPEVRTVFAGFLDNPDQFTKKQKQDNIASDAKK